MSLDRVSAGRDVPNDCNVIIEIPMHGDPIKYEVDKDTGAVFVDRFMSTSMHYPCNYGYIPQTLSDDGDPSDVLVTITHRDIQSSLGYCTILSNRRDGRTFFVHVSCKMAGDQTILGDVTFKQRDDNALDFDDQDHTSTGVLYKCAK